jgi:glycosyltransferase involved in cell wall biosynthesis
MRICHLTTVHSYTDTRIFVKECQSLSSAGFETYLVAPDAPNKIINHIYIHGVQKSKGNRLLRMTKTVWSVYQKAKGIDASIYHFHDPELIPVGLIFRLKGKKVIYDVHEDVPRQILSKHWIPKPLRQMISWFFEPIENYAARFFSAIVAATPFITQRFLAINPHTVNINNYPVLSELFMEDNWGDKNPNVCYIGGISQDRGIIQMVEAIDKMNAKLLLAGKFSMARLREETINMSGWTKVEELGYLDRTAVKQILSRSFAGLVILHPIINYLDSLPIKMFEYMSAGIPVIASNFPMWKDIVEGNGCGICVDPLNITKVSEAIQWLIDHPNEARLMGQKGREAVENKYNWEVESVKLINLYNKLK